MTEEKPSSFSTLHQAPPLPRYFVPRPAVDQAIRALLFTEGTGAPPVLAIHGLAGVGKTTAAASVAHDPEVQARFADGILWVTLGQEPELLVRLHGWIRAVLAT
jgi:hypothetical protein